MRATSATSLTAIALSLGLVLAACTDQEPPAELEPAPTEETAGPEDAQDPGDDGAEEEGSAGDVRGYLTPLDGTGLEREVGSVNLTGVLGDDLGWIAVGSVTEPGEPQVGVLATSEDGVDWDLDDLPHPDGTEHRAAEVVRLESTTLVVGATRVGADHHLVLWTGGPGSWDLVELGEELDPMPGLSLTGSTVTADGEAVVVGYTTEEDGTRAASVWRIDEEGSVEHLQPFDEAGQLTDVTPFDGDLIAIGRAGDAAFPPPIVLRSQDGGASWSTVETSGLDDVALDGIDQVDDRLAIGGRTDTSGAGGAAIWFSDDGESWESQLPDGDRGTSHVGSVHRLDGQLLALGTWLELTDPATDAFETWGWPGDGVRGGFGSAAQHDGRIVAVGSRTGAPHGLLTATSADEWQTIRLADDILASTTGVVQRLLNGLGATADEAVVVGRETSLGADGLTDRMFAGTAPDFAPALEGIAGDGARFVALEHAADHGWIAVGHDSDERAQWGGPRAAGSDDGETWTEYAVEGGTADRILSVVATGERVLAIGMGWDGGEVLGSLWELSDDGFEPIEVEGLDDWVAIDGCAREEVVLLKVFQGGATRALAVSDDGGNTFEVVEDGPLETATGFNCDLDDDGVAVVVSDRSGTNQAHRFDPDARSWEELSEASDGPRVSLSHVRWLPDLGWVVTGSQVTADESEPVVRVSSDLTSWQEVGFEGDPVRASASLVAATDDTLYVSGRVDGDPQMWSMPRAELD